MQALTAAPRETLTKSSVRTLLGSAMTTSMGLETLAADLSVTGDISEALGAGSISRDMDGNVHGTCSLNLDVDLPWGTTLLRPYTLLEADGRPTRTGVASPRLQARFNLGVFAIATPGRHVDATGDTPRQVTGYDRLYLLDRLVPDTQVVTAGTGYLDAVRSAVTASGLPVSTLLLDSAATGKTLPRDRTFPLLPQPPQPAATSTEAGDAGEDETAKQSGWTWLGMVNELLSAIGYRGLWADENGYLRSGPWIAPAARAPEWTFDATRQLSEQIAALGEEADLMRDDWALPNRWTFYQQNAPINTAPLTYTVDDLPGRARRGGLIWPAQPVALDAVDQAALQARGDAIVAEDLRVATTITHTSSPLPLVGHADTYAVSDSRLGPLGTVTSTAWSQGWDEDGLLADVQHTWRLV